MSATDKMKVYKKWISFLNNHFSQKMFSKQLYEHLHGHCGYIAHYDIHGFYSNYFEKGASFNKMAFGVETKMSDYGGIGSHDVNFLGKDAIETKQAFHNIILELLFGKDKYDEGLASFYSNWNGKNYLGASYNGDYGDLNSAMKDALSEYISIWNDMAEVIQNKLSKAEEQTRLKEIKLQKKRLQDSMSKAKNQMKKLDKEIEDELLEFDSEKESDTPFELNLFDFLDSEVA